MRASGRPLSKTDWSLPDDDTATKRLALEPRVGRVGRQGDLGPRDLVADAGAAAAPAVDRLAVHGRRALRRTSRRRSSGRRRPWAAGSCRSGRRAGRPAGRPTPAAARARPPARAGRRRRSRGSRPRPRRCWSGRPSCRCSRRGPVGWTCRSRSPVDDPTYVVVTRWSTKPYRTRRPARARPNASPSAGARASKTWMSVSAGGSAQSADVGAGHEVLRRRRPGRRREPRRRPPATRTVDLVEGRRAPRHRPRGRARRTGARTRRRRRRCPASRRWWSGCCWPSAGWRWWCGGRSRRSRRRW